MEQEASGHDFSRAASATKNVGLYRLSGQTFTAYAANFFAEPQFLSAPKFSYLSIRW
jgi:hypothetical protein